MNYRCSNCEGNAETFYKGCTLCLVCLRTLKIIPIETDKTSLTIPQTSVYKPQFQQDNKRYTKEIKK